MNKLQLIGGKFEGVLETRTELVVGSYLSLTVVKDNDGKENHTIRPRKDTYLVKPGGVATKVSSGTW